MKNRRIIIRGAEQRALVSEILSNVEQDGTVEVLIRPYHKDRSYEQNRLYWKWIGVIIDELESEDTKKSIHEAFKHMFLVPLLSRDSERFFNLMKIVNEQGTKEDQTELISALSTTRLSVKQMTEYLNEIEKHAASLSIVLPQP